VVRVLSVRGVVTGGPPGFPPALLAPRPLVSADVTIPGEPAPAGGPCIPGIPFSVVARGEVCALSRLKWAPAVSLRTVVSVRTVVSMRVVVVTVSRIRAVSERVSIER
jgi:hypothetical protein